MITAAIILAKAAALFEKKNAIQSQSYGAAARGGATRSDIIIDKEEICFPNVTQPNILIFDVGENEISVTVYNHHGEIIDRITDLGRRPRE